MEAGLNYDINLGGDANAEFKILAEQMKLLVASFGKFDQQVDKVFTEVKQQANQVNKSIKAIEWQSISQGLQQVGQVIGEMSKPGLVFETQMANLSAITGIMGAELDTLGVAAKEVGASTGLGAAQAAEAFKLLASNIDVTTIGGVEGLKALQKEVITLAQAGGVDLTTSADTMAAAINQFGLKGTDAARVINVLAAGAKFGAAEIPQLADSLKKVGSVAGAFGVSLEATTGALEILSQSGIKSELAGTGLASIITRMKTMLGVDFSKMSLTDALVQLKPKLNDADFLMKTFGQDNIDVAAVLIKNADKVGKMTDAVTGTNVATKQAEINTSTWQTTLDKMKATLDNVKISISQATGPLMPMIGVMGDWLVTLAQIAPAIMLIKEATSAWTLANGVLEGSMLGINFALTGTQVLLASLGIGLLIAGLVLVVKNWDSIVEGIQRAIDKTREFMGQPLSKERTKELDVKAKKEKGMSQMEDGTWVSKEGYYRNDEGQMVKHKDFGKGSPTPNTPPEKPLINFGSGSTKSKVSSVESLSNSSAPGTTSGKAMIGNIRFESVIKQVIINVTRETEDIGKRIKDEVVRATMAGVEDVKITKMQGS